MQPARNNTSSKIPSQFENLSNKEKHILNSTFKCLYRIVSKFPNEIREILNCFITKVKARTFQKNPRHFQKIYRV